MTAGAPAIRVHGLGGGYGPGDPVITGLDFEVPAGTMVAVLGPNGGGKTTLFRALLGELPRRSGKVALNGRAAYVPQTERRGSSPSKARNRVVLPPPLGPSTATVVPAGTSKSRSVMTGSPGP